MDAEALVEAALSQFEETLFPDTGSIQRAMFVEDEEGSRSEEWSDLYTGLRVQLSAFFPASGPESEQGGTEQITASREQRAILHAYVDDVLEADRLVIDDRVFDIVGVELDSWRLVTTLRVDERNGETIEGS